MIPSRSARILLCSVAVACAFSFPKASAQLDPDLLAWEPFNYSTTPSVSTDRNSDGNVDLLGLNGGFGFGGAWNEQVDLDMGSAPLDYIQPLSLGVPASSAGLLTAGGSLRSYMLSTEPQTTLSRTLLEPIPATDGSFLWFSVLIRAERFHTTGATSPSDNDNFKFELRSSNSTGVSFGDGTSGGFAQPRNYFLRDNSGGATNYADRGPGYQQVDLLVVKFSFLGSSADTVELFLNPTPGIVPTSPDARIELASSLSDIASIYFWTDFTTSPSSFRTQWSVDEIRLGKTYDSVTPTVPEPSSLLLAGFGLGAAGFTRLRRNRAA